MADQQHRATAQQWRDVKAMAFGSLAYSTILELRDRIKALEAKDEDDKESWAARLRKTGISAALRIKALKRRIDALEATQRAINQSSTNRIHLGLGDIPEITSASASGLSAAVNQAASEAFRADNWIAWPDEVAATEAKSNHPEIPDSSLERRVSEHIKAQSVLTAALVKRLEALEGVPLDGAVPAKVPGGLPALAEKVKALEDTVNATTQPNHPAKPDSSLVEQVAAAIHPNVCADPNLYLHEARAAIRVVAAWLSEHAGGTDSPLLLEREAER